MSTAIAGEEVSANPSNEEPASKKIRLEDEPSLNVEDPNDNSLQDSNCTQSNKVAATPVDNASPDINKGPRGKHKYAILLCYCGKGYFGMQRCLSLLYKITHTKYIIEILVCELLKRI